MGKIKGISILSLGCRRAGKSQLNKQLLIEDNLLGESDVIYIFTNSFNRQHYMDCGIEEGSIFHTVDSELIEDILQFQEQCRKEKKPMLSITMIFDDIFGSRKQKTGKLMDSIEKIWALGRHMNISIVVCLQDIRYASHLLSNTDVAFFFPNSIRKKTQRDFIKNEIISNYTEDLKKIDECFKNKQHQFTMVHLTTETDKWDEIVYKGKVPMSIIKYKVKTENNIFYDLL